MQTIIRNLRRVPTALALAVAIGIPAAAEAQQMAVAPPVEGAIEGTLAKTAGAPVVPGVALDVAHGFNDVWAVEGRVSGVDHRSIGAGLRVSTPFYYGSSRDPVPGRFFAHVLTGPGRKGGWAGTEVLVGAGAEVLLSRHAPIGLHWELDGRRVLDAQRWTTEFALGVVIR
jgi:hypothetical protein